MELTFQPATPAELATAVAIARAASVSPYSHWDADYPNQEILAEDIARGELYLLREDGVPRAMISILDEALECNLVSFPWPEKRERTCMLARLGIVPEAQGRGLAAETMRLAADAARARGFTAARLLASEDNPVTNHIYQKLGYHPCGHARLWDEEDFVGYELPLG